MSELVPPVEPEAPEAFVKALRVLRIEPGDVVVLHVQQQIPTAAAHRIVDFWTAFSQKTWGRVVPCLVLNGGIEIDVVRMADAAAVESDTLAAGFARFCAGGRES